MIPAKEDSRDRSIAALRFTPREQSFHPLRLFSGTSGQPLSRRNPERGQVIQLNVQAQGSRPRIGVLAIQGDYVAHAEALAESGAEPVEVRKPDELATLDGLILPGGESTTILRFLEKHNFFTILKDFCGSKPVFGTCAGAILLAREVRNPAQLSLGALDAVVERNAYGRQIDSTILTAETDLPGGPLEMVFIRAPRIIETGSGVKVLSRRDGSPTLVKQGPVMAATFHPELSPDRRVHQLFVQTVKEARKQ